MTPLIFNSDNLTLLQQLVTAALSLNIMPRLMYQNSDPEVSWIDVNIQLKSFVKEWRYVQSREEVRKML